MPHKCTRILISMHICMRVRLVTERTDKHTHTNSALHLQHLFSPSPFDSFSFLFSASLHLFHNTNVCCYCCCCCYGCCPCCIHMAVECLKRLPLIMIFHLHKIKISFHKNHRKIAQNAHRHTHTHIQTQLQQ